MLNSRVVVLYAATIIVIIGHGSKAKACLEVEREALLKYKAFLKRPASLSSWINDSNSDCCGWERVTCDPDSGHVTHLSLQFLNGVYPHPDDFDPYNHQCLNFLTLDFSFFIPFKNLTTIDFSFNCFNNSIFTQDHGGMSTLKTLEAIDLSYCSFNISVIDTLTSFTSLKTLLLRNNFLDGPFPVRELLALRNLEHLDLSGNRLQSPSEIDDFKRMSELKNLETLDLSQNYLTINVTSIFRSLSPLKFLKNLLLSEYSMGTLGPLAIDELSVLQNLETLDLSKTSLTITSSSSTTLEYSKTLSRLMLETLDLSGTHIVNANTTFKFLSHLPNLRSLILHESGILFGEQDNEVFTDLPNLEVLILRSVSGTTVPIQGLCKMKNLQELDVSDNHLTGSLSSFSCLKNLTSLRALDLSRNFLSGNISLSFLAHNNAPLEYLSLADNNFEGTFPLSTLANYSDLKVLRLGRQQNKKFQVETENPPWIPSFQLQYLDMSSCQLNSATGTIPTFLSNQSSLIFIDLSNNNLLGRFPNWLLMNNPKLEALFLNNNLFNGYFEDQKMNIHLYTLDVSNNMIQGKLPTSLGFSFPYLEYLNASFNVLDGDIPASVGEMSTLRTLDLAYNNLSGELPNEMFKGCISLQILSLSHNKFQGQILAAPLSMTFLSVLMLDNNNFHGKLQDGLRNMQHLGLLDLSNNDLSGELPGWVVGNLNLVFLSVSGNNFEGAIPRELCELEFITFVSLSHNRFSGALPSCLGNSSSWLKFIHLRNNSLAGTIPESILNNSELFSLDLGDNNISGSVPNSVNGLTNLKYLSLAGNRLQGQLPKQICELKQLNFLDLSRNNFSGTIPTCFNNISFGNQGNYYDFLANYFRSSYFGFIYSQLLYINFQYHNFDVEMHDKVASYFAPEEMRITTKGSSLSYKGNILNNMSGLDLSCNQLEGKISQTIGDLVALHALNLSHNHLVGSIPDSFQKLKMIESLDLSFNRLSGQIPLQLQGLNSLAVFNVSYNNFSGRAPDEGQFATFGGNSYIGNPYLSWRISNRGTAMAPLPALATFNNGEDNSVIDFTSFCWTFAASYVMVVLVFIAILWINPYWRRKWFYFIEDCLYKCFGGVLKDVFY
ncbi:hypothetical protein HN51_057985 [Arachis hypogaea]|uniref:Leucine-rich repeat-containing N-terminal plant-type domain-containing protein n=1 Tax=Arachis hypogaea TaxID=3818 RepID=A0A444WZ67_ARAHY|nr:LRR receptor-like serine/threonine-protein kinase FLS2 [Arachis ipaensis]XP_025684078.1 receptor-like protein 13 [Arachis hypogaea]QHN81122.1 LRR receptor-like serine/threonine-protein kinase [Arachis hypogaea]RYQ82642.1 hypothetical protein Ahy_B10g101223 isoform B [Arachis hypogaea]